MTRTLLAALLTLGDPATLTGGYLFHRRLAELAPCYDARIEFISLPHRPFPLAVLDGPAVLRDAAALGADAFVLDSIAAAFLAPALRLQPPGVPVLGMLHQPPGGIDHGPLRSAVQARLDRLAYRRAQRLLLASESLAQELVAEGFAGDQLSVIPPGRDVVASPVPAAQNLRRGRSAALLSVGNWVERKGLLDLLEAFARLPPSAATLHLAGDDRAEPHYAARLRARLARPDLAERVVVHGPLPREEVAALYAGADAFVLASRKEPFGTVYGEAMSYGLPVVGWRAGNLPYLAEHEREGLLVDPGDVEGLAAALARLASDEGLRRRLGQAAAQRAEKRPTWADTAARFFAEIRDVVERYPRLRPEAHEAL